MTSEAGNNRYDRFPGVIARRLRAVTAPVQPHEFIARVHEEVRAGLSKGDIALPAVAARLGLAEPTLYRRLRASNVRYSDLVRRLRYDTAAALLRMPDLPLTEIALRLGYSELSAFTRASHRWSGLSPSAYRRRNFG